MIHIKHNNAFQCIVFYNGFKTNNDFYSKCCMFWFGVLKTNRVDQNVLMIRSLLSIVSDLRAILMIHE